MNAVGSLRGVKPRVWLLYALYEMYLQVDDEGYNSYWWIVYTHYWVNMQVEDGGDNS